MVSAQIDILLDVVGECRVGIDSMHTRSQMAINVLNGWQLRLAGRFGLVRTIELRGKRYHHGIDIDLQRRVIFVERFCQLLAAASAAVSHQRPCVGSLTHHNDASVGNLGICIGVYAVLISSNLFRSGICAGSCRVSLTAVAGMKRHSLLVAAYVETDLVAHPHGGGHQLVAIRLRVAEPGRQFFGIAAVGQLVGTELGHLGQLAFFKLRVSASGQKEKDDGHHSIDRHYQ
ncbi:unknown [Prevotella sp. CAG:485]|nr:unknown [Prevotella sp. CAG:485]